MGNSEKNAVISYLRVIMVHIIKWYSQPEHRSNSWKNSINNSREKIIDIREKKPSISDEHFKENWDKTFKEATEKAEKEMNQESKVDKLTWDQVFKNKYIISAILLFITVFGVLKYWI